MAYATVSDVEARTARTYTPAEESVISALLDDAAVMIDAYNEDASAAAKKIVSCRMVLRATAVDDAITPLGASQGSATAGPYTQSWTVASGGSVGELYLGRTDKQLLGGGSRIGSYSPVEGLVPDA